MTTPNRPPTDRADDIARAWQREQPGLPVGSIGILTRIQQAAKLLSDQRRRVLTTIGIDAATLDLLSTLRRAGPPYRLSTRELTARCLVTAGAITQRVDRAEREGLVRRLTAQPGNRTVPVELTDKGHRAVEGAVRDLLTHEQTLVDTMKPQQQAELARLLAVFLQGLAAQAGTHEGA